ncbi:MAG: NHLP bacteriocin export ABC transporter permease/ATPase subunit [Desulfobacteraceae bacterium]|nr:NHLP bacteriocin export ABC transporter permease/ATPase subunit [Desulfobacteraceae bacterium]
MTEPQTSLALNATGPVHRLEAGQVIPLCDPEIIWCLESGSVEIHLSRYQDREPVGERRLLFHVEAGGFLFGALPDETAGGLGWIATGSSHSVVREIRFSELCPELISREDVWRLAASSWIDPLCRLMSAGESERSASALPVEPGEFEFREDELLTVPEGECGLVRVASGQLSMVGCEESALRPEDGFMLLGPDLCLRVCSESSRICFHRLPGGCAEENLKEAFASFFRRVNLSLDHHLAEDESAEIARRKASREQEALAAATASEELASVARPRDFFPTRESALLTAVTVIGQIYGVRINPPAHSEDMSLVGDPIEAIARASHIRCRKIHLAPQWWKHDSGPVLAFLGPDRVPVALLPRGPNYDVVHPETRQREPLTKQIRDRVGPEAYMFYRPFPEKISKGIQVARFAFAGRAGDLLFLVLMGAFATLLGMLVPKVTGELVDTAIPTADRGYVVQLALILTAAGVAGALFTFSQVMTTLRSGLVMEVGAQSALWDRLLKLSPRFFRRFASGDLQTRVNAVGEISRELNAATMRPFISGVLALLNFLLLWYYSWELAKWALLAGLIMLVTVLVVGYFERMVSIALQASESDTSSLVIQMIGGVAKIRVAGAEKRATNYWLAKYSRQLQLMFRFQRLKDVMSVINQILMPLASAIIFWKAVDLIVGTGTGAVVKNGAEKELISVGDFIAFNTAFILYLTGWTDLTNALVQVLDAVAKGDRIRPLVEEEPEVKVDATDPGRLRGGLRLENIQFRYTGDGPVVLDEISCEVRPGEYVAFVGPSGSGKSTLLRVMLGFERPQYGRVLYDGQDLSGLDILAVRRQIGTVLQNGRLNAGSIVDNIANNAPLSVPRIWEAVNDAALSDDINCMAMGLHTLVSEGGGNLSGGQRQRLLIARALALRPKIVMFDEATSALDNRTQAIVSASLDRRKVTRVVIAHRLSTIRQADRIYVIDKGRIVQVGTFEELSGQEGMFRLLMVRQMV